MEVQRKTDAKPRSLSRRPDEQGRVPLSLYEMLKRYERLLIIQSLQANDFSRVKTARSLKLTPKSLWRRMKSLAIDFSDMPTVRTGRPKKIIPS
jgi:DNA-binding NtrC family response regulator